MTCSRNASSAPGLDGRPLVIASLAFATLLTSSVARAQRVPTFDHRPQSTAIPKPATIVIPSPNYNARDATSPVDSIVFHTTEVNLAGTIDIFLDPARSVSAHFVVAPNGDIYEMVDTSRRAWHATYYNSRSIGIEMVGYAGNRSTWNDDNVGALVDLVSWLMEAYPAIPLSRPLGDAYDYPGDRLNAPGWVAHGQVQPWNRTDPGPYFPWDDVAEQVSARLAAAIPEPAGGALAAVAIGGGWLAIQRRRRGAPSD